MVPVVVMMVVVASFATALAALAALLGAILLGATFPLRSTFAALL